MESVRCMVCPPVLERFNCISTDFDLSLLSQLLVSRIAWHSMCLLLLSTLIIQRLIVRQSPQRSMLTFVLNCLLLTFTEETWSQFAGFLCYYDSSVCDNSILKSLDGKKHEEVVYLATKKSVNNRGAIQWPAACA